MISRSLTRQRPARFAQPSLQVAPAPGAMGLRKRWEKPLDRAAAAAQACRPRRHLGTRTAAQGGAKVQVRRRDRLGWQVVLVGCALALAACGAVQTQGDGVGSATYQGASQADPVLGGPAAAQAAAALQDIGAARGLHLVGDGRLARLAQYLLDEQARLGDLPQLSAIEAQTRHLGIYDPLPSFSLFSDNRTQAALTHVLDNQPRNMVPNRFGLADIAWKNQRMLAIVLVSSRVDLQPVPRTLPPGRALHLRGRLAPGYRDAELVVTPPHGASRKWATGHGADVDLACTLAETGMHKVELMAQGSLGPEVVANFPVFVGIPEPDPNPADARSRSADGQELRDVPAIQARLLQLLNDVRRQNGLPPVTPDAALLHMAEGHSRDMVAAGFFGHTSPTAGDLTARSQRAGLRLVRMGENLGRGPTAEAVHEMLLDSPGHRAVALDPRLNRVGIGVVVTEQQGRPSLFVTEDFGCVPAPLDIDVAANTWLLRLQQARAKAGRAPIAVDATLMTVARKVAAGFMGQPARTALETVGGIGAELAAAPGRPASPILSTLLAAAFPDDIEVPQLALGADVHKVGVGLAQGDRPEIGPGGVAIVLLLATGP